MKNVFIILLVFSVVVGCGQGQDDYYFDFDQIDHYSIEVDENKLLDRYDALDLSEEESLLLAVIIRDTPTSLSDTAFLADLESAGFQKKILKGSKLEEINEIFRKKLHKEVSAMACIAVYRDVLVFRKKEKIVGIAKICFSCKQNQIHGTEIETWDFGQSGDYDKLESILKDLIKPEGER